MQTNEQQTVEQVDFEAEAKKLRRHFEFTAADLQENQKGILSEKQRKRVAKNAKGGKVVGLIIGFCLFGGAIVFIPGLLVWFQQLDVMQDMMQDYLWLQWTIMPLWGGIGLVIALLLLLMFAAGIFLIVSQMLGKTSYRLLSVRGRARLEKGHGNRRSHVYYDLYINDRQFDGDSTMNKAIIEGAEYIVYYIEGAEEIMSVELVRVSN